MNSTVQIQKTGRRKTSVSLPFSLSLPSFLSLSLSPLSVCLTACLPLSLSFKHTHTHRRICTNECIKKNTTAKSELVKRQKNIKKYWLCLTVMGKEFQLLAAEKACCLFFFFFFSFFFSFFKNFIAFSPPFENCF